MRVPSISVFVRHSRDCKYRDDETWRRCTCRKHLRWTHAGKQFRQSARTRSWANAEEEKRRIEAQFENPGTVAPVVREGKRTIEQAIQTFIMAKQTEGCSASTIRKLRFQLKTFQDFMVARSKMFPHEISVTDVIEFRATWTSWKSGLTRQKAQQNLRGFLRTACRENLPDLLDVLKPIRLAKTDIARIKPRPFSEHELKKLLAQVPVTFASYPEKIEKVTVLIRFMAATGTAIRDTVQLERSAIKGGWLHFERQKTGKAVHQKLDSGLCEELLSVAGEKYIFWNGNSTPTSAAGLWQADLRQLMKDAGVWIKGNLAHRFRDTAVDFWLQQGTDLTTVAALLGDTLRVVERSYADLASNRMRERVAKAPIRSWNE